MKSFYSLKQAQTFRYLLVLSMIFLGLTVQAQDKTISGVVKDQSGIPLPGVNIKIKSTTTGTITNFDGEFTLAGVSSDNTILFSFMGYEAQEVVVGTNQNFDIVLEESTELLSEIVVVGYGTQKKENLTGAVGVVTPDKDIGNQAITNTETLLQGRIAGVQLTQSGGKPGAGAEITIRGNGTLNNSSPLVLIDGIPGSMQDILPSDIESVSVLKDAASASIYGTRAANGVILVTTKKGGKNEKIKLSYNGYAGVQKATVLPDFLDSWDYMTLKNEASVNAGRSPIYTDEEIAIAKAGTDPYKYGNTDWADETFKDGAFFQNHQVSLTQKVGKTQYLASLGYLDQNGIMYGTSAERLNYRINLKSELGKGFTFGTNFFGAVKTAEESGDTDDQGVMRLIANSSPLVPVFNPDGSWGSASGNPYEINTKNPVFYATEASRKTTKSNKNTINPYLEFNPVQGLTFRTNFSYSYTQAFNKTHKYTFQLTDSDGNDSDVGRQQNSLQDISNTYETVQWENTVNYEKKLNRHSINLLAGTTMNTYKHKWMKAKVTDLPSNDLTEIGSGSNPTVDGTFNESRLMSVFGRVQYSYDDRYLIEANLRTDGSSKFPSNNRYAIFPALSAGWIFSNEAFLESENFLSFGKIRANWGQLGNDKIGYYPYSQSYTPTDGYPFDGSQIYSGGLAVIDLANPDIKWETTTSYGIGADLGFWDDKLTVTADYFVKDTDDILLKLPIPGATGITSPAYQNAGRVKNTGWELAVNHYNTIGNTGIEYNIGFNVTHIDNEIISMQGETQYPNNRQVNMEGSPIGSFYGYNNTGIYRTEEDLESYPYIDGQTPQLGDLIYEDINGDGVIDDKDRTIIGNPNPEYTYGINLGIAYKGFDLKVFLQGVQNVDIYSSSTGNHSGAGNNLMNWTTDWMDRWTPENPNATKPRLGNVNNEEISSFWVEDASYLRLKNIEVGYTFSQNVCKKLKVQNFRIFANSTNPITWTQLEHWDPERYASQSRNEAYPQTTTLTFGTNITF
ncbi:SusC/RagA family TonB-linked outer membrane protein [Flammeovirga agarivorans]|uniref:TonB-dependent receptor n=1 Tax=Flammeovirga agarivorans TaxID=2726742 RepID=A0A7X8SQM5_9BACT|nr:TonB-dependent receptor [Flammeovirga agarivorans]NLR94619.1 TonB-dependent receptor [Flammeovirga agarivorans]